MRLFETLAILQANQDIALDRKPESTAMCRLEAKFKLKNFSFIFFSQINIADFMHAWRAYGRNAVANIKNVNFM